MDDMIRSHQHWDSAWDRGTSGTSRISQTRPMWDCHTCGSMDPQNRPNVGMYGIRGVSEFVEYRAGGRMYVPERASFQKSLGVDTEGGDFWGASCGEKRP